MKEFTWKQATLGQLYEIARHDKGCNPRFRILAREELSRRAAAKRSNIKYKAMGRNWG